MITRRSTFGLAAGVAALFGLPVWARQPRHVIYWSIELPNVATPPHLMNYHAHYAKMDFEFREADLATMEYVGTRPTEHSFVVRHYWKCERTDKAREECAALSAKIRQSSNEDTAKHLRLEGFSEDKIVAVNQMRQRIYDERKAATAHTRWGVPA